MSIFTAIQIHLVLLNFQIPKDFRCVVQAKRLTLDGGKAKTRTLIQTSGLEPRRMGFGLAVQTKTLILE